MGGEGVDTTRVHNPIEKQKVETKGPLCFKYS